MGFLPVGMAALSAWLFAQSDNSLLMWVSTIVGLGAFWSFGVMHNLATDQAKTRTDYRGRFSEFVERDLDAVPAGITFANMAFSVASLLCLVGAAATYII